MRITRSKLRQEYKNKSFGLTVAFTILLPILSIYLGYTAFRLVIAPGMQSKEVPQQSTSLPSEEAESDNQQNSETISKQEATEEAFVTTFELEGFNFYSIQIGKFTTIENAEAMKTELKAKGYEGHIHQQDGFKVIAVSLLSRTGIDSELQRIRKEYPDAYVTTINIPAQLIKYTKDDNKNTLSIEEQNKKTINTLLKISEQVEKLSKESADVENIKTVADESLKEFESIKNELSKIATSSNIGKVAQDLVKVIDLAILHLKEAKQTGAISDLQKSLNEALYEYVGFSVNNKY
ncbi:hypothetical protein HNQ80_001002 [Anaerosolibacter carboniphilus]|uniref:SPOR domain-containing protein n=1 Tax=Anaerosolibacter carboniphilus TaxID=1417629 RepID=A0A841KN94_9FIRM|nr:SPOR domain-containing protein [Anaerosolibacter carboniphilus]MBB6214917.1 hypothetical protein [Anaerosolibacter carboniphilus]